MEVEKKPEDVMVMLQRDERFGLRAYLESFFGMAVEQHFPLVADEDGTAEKEQRKNPEEELEPVVDSRDRGAAAGNERAGVGTERSEAMVVGERDTAGDKSFAGCIGKPREIGLVIGFGASGHYQHGVMLAEGTGELFEEEAGTVFALEE